MTNNHKELNAQFNRQSLPLYYSNLSISTNLTVWCINLLFICFTARQSMRCEIVCSMTLLLNGRRAFNLARPCWYARVDVVIRVARANGVYHARRSIATLMCAAASAQATSSCNTSRWPSPVPLFLWILAQILLSCHIKHKM